MQSWNADHYLKYGNERTRAAEDLLARIKLENPGTVVDLGCGPGNSTQILCQRWPRSTVLGIDNSPEMIETARSSFADQNWILADVSAWTPEQPVDLMFSNAALQWLPGHRELVRRLFANVAAGGALAFQVPSCTFAEVRKLIHEVSADPKWSSRMDQARAALTLESPAFYYDALVGDAAGLDIWETEYCHVLESRDAIVDWMSSTGLRPFFQALASETEREKFVAQLRRRVDESYEVRSDGKVLFPFRRTFVIAYRRAGDQ